MRRNGVTVTVARKKHHFTACDAAESERARRLTARRADNLAPGNFQVRELRQAAAADDG